MKTFDDLDFKPHPNPMGGVQALMEFENGYGVSVIQTSFSYGGAQGLYELAVLDKGGLTYSTPVTSDVEGYLSPEDVTRLMKDVQSLPKTV